MSFFINSVVLFRNALFSSLLGKGALKGALKADKILRSTDIALSENLYLKLRIRLSACCFQALRAEVSILLF